MFVTMDQPSPVTAAALAVSPAVVPQEGQGSRAASTNEGISFVDFLSRVGQAVVDTQRQLDQKSREYLAQHSTNEFAAPAAFRLPKLSGKMLFELEYDKNKGVNLVFHSRSDKEIQRNQQSIEFDIVSVPAPPGAAEAVRKQASIDLIFDPVARKSLLERNAAADPKNALPQEAVDDPSRILLLRTQAAAEDPKYLVVYAGGDKASNVGMWVSDSAGIQVIYRFQKQNSEFEPRFRDLVSALADAQKQLLEPSGA